MRNLARNLVVLASLALVVPACATHEQAGAATGATIGAVTGHALTDSPIGALIGAIIGASVGADIGRQLDEADRLRTAYALEYYRTGDTHRWANPDTGHRYSCTPTRTYDGDRGPCREFTLLTIIEGERAEIQGTACRDRDGTWRTLR